MIHQPDRGQRVRDHFKTFRKVEIGRLPLTPDWVKEVVRRRKMTELYREYRRCGGCRYFSPFRNSTGGECFLWTMQVVNSGWFACRKWKSLKQIALSLLQTTQRKLKGG